MKRYIYLFALILVVMISTMSCAKEEKDAPTEPVRIFGVVRGDEAEIFRSILADFTAETGIEVVYEESSEFETQILVQVEAGTPPDIAGVPQPGLMYRFASEGKLVKLWPKITEMVESNYELAWEELGSYEGTFYGIFNRVNAKSFVWYNKKEWAKRGYPIPQTWDELIALSDQMVADGIAPWSVTMESGTATGWYGTDWIEDVLLRTSGAEVYDQWVRHEIPFNDPKIAEAMGYARQIFFTPDYVYGGIETAPSIFFGDGVLPLFSDPPKAMMYKQGSFVIGFLPDEVKANLDEYLGVFPLPPIKSGTSAPMMGGGEMYIVFNDRPEVRKVMEFLTTWESGKKWAAKGGALYPFKDQDFDVYPTEIERELAKAVVNAGEFRFDGSDLMPPDVGNSSFWTGMVEWTGGKSDQDVLDEIEASWP